LIIKQLLHNITPITNRKIEYIVIHDTANTRAGADAYANFLYFNSGDRQASADYFIDQNSIYKVNDPSKYYTWHVGDGKNKNGINNKNSIGVEMCVNADGDFARTIANTIILVRSLQDQYPSAKVVRHFDASGKHCPASLSKNEWQGWIAFLNMLKTPEPRSDTLHWAEPYYQALTEKYGIKIDKRDFDKTITRGEMYAILFKMLERNKK
jgi:N-acetylmuramoyl-L-alanine amidase CwlA